MKKTKKTDLYDFKSKEIKKNRYVNDDYKMIIGFAIMIIIIVISTLLLYFFNGKFVTKDLSNKDTTTTTLPTYDDTKITVADLFKIKKDNYYVILYDTEDDMSFLYSTLASSYDNEDIPLYTIDIANTLNKKYYDTKGKENRKPSTSSDVMITRPTLIEIKKGKVVKYITNKDDIVSTLS